MAQVAKRLDAYRNFAVDVAARVRFLMREDRETVRQFLLKYSDRVLYASDFQPGAGSEAGAAKSFVASHELEWSYYSGGDALEYLAVARCKVWRCPARFSARSSTIMP